MLSVLKAIYVVLFYPLSLLYRFFFYWKRKRTSPTHLPSSLTVSIGNLSVGGTGKTPFTIFMIQELFRLPGMDLPYVVLSRGFGGKWSSYGNRVKEDSSSRDSGDEPLLIKRNLPFVDVLVGRNRIQTFGRYWDIRSSPDNTHSPIVLLDDGFQHFAIERDIDIVLIDSTRLIGNGLTLPVGLLRETIDSLSRAHVLIFTRYNPDRWNETTLRKQKSLEAKIQAGEGFSHLKVFHAKETVTAIQELAEDGRGFWEWQNREPGSLHGRNLFAFCGLGNPKPFFDQVEEWAGRKIERKSYPDHYFYSDKDINDLKNYEFDFLVCTEKDMVKFSSKDLQKLIGKLLVVKIRIEVLEKANWESFLKNVRERVLGKPRKEPGEAHLA